MKFIFPQNYNFNNKIFGLIDYSTAIINVIWYVFIYCLCNLIFKSLNLKIFIFIILTLPLLLFSIIGFNHENIVYVFSYLIKYIQKPKIYLYGKAKPFKEKSKE